MSKTIATSIRLDEELKKELTHDLEQIGLTINSYFTLAAKQLVLQKKIPFEVIIKNKDVPNEITKKALLTAEAKELGIIKDNSPRFDNIDDLMGYLDEK